MLNNKNKMFIDQNMPFEFYILCFVVFWCYVCNILAKVSKKEFPRSGGFTITSSDEGNVESRREVNQSVDG